MNKERAAMTGALGAAFLVSSCCLGPTLFIVFGVSAGALSGLSVLEPYQPFFFTAGAACLGYAAWRIYWKPATWKPAQVTQPAQPAEVAAAECGDDACAPGSTQRRATRAMFWISLVAFAVGVGYPFALEAYLKMGAN